MVRPTDKVKTAARREDVKGFMETIGPYSVPNKVLAEKWEVTEKTIRNDIHYWLKRIDLKKIDFEGRKLIMSIRKNLSLVESMRIEGNSAEKIKAIQTTNQTAETLTRLMENYGFKEKIAENLNVNARLPTIINLIEKSVEEIKDAKHKNKPENPGDKSKASRNPQSS